MRWFVNHQSSSMDSITEYANFSLDNVWEGLEGLQENQRT